MAKSDKQFKEVSKQKIDKIASSPQFEAINIPFSEEMRTFFIFRWKGDSIVGILGSCQTNYQRNSSYPVTLDNGNTVEIFGNKLLHDIIRDNELIGSQVKIVYIGKQAGPWGRPRKIYRVYKDTGSVTPQVIEQRSEKHPYVNPKKVLKET